MLTALMLLSLVLPVLAQPCDPPTCPLAQDLTSAVGTGDGAGTSSTEVYFSPFDNVEDQVLRVLDSAEKEVVIAHYNIRRQTVLDKLVELSRRGVVVKVAVDETNAGHEWNVGDDFLEQHGIKVVRTKPSGASALMHLKATVIDGKRLMTGSFNWNATAALANDENMLLIEDAGLAQVYRGEVLEVLGEGGKKVHGQRVGDAYEVHFSPEERLDSVIAGQINKARKSVDVAMFTLSDRKVQEALEKAAQRGVRVRVITENKQASKIATDEKVEQAGAQVVRGANRVGSFSAMHQKYAVIDGEVVLTGAANWTKNGTQFSNEDLLAIRSRELAARYEENFADLLHVYGGIDSPPGSAPRSVTPALMHVKQPDTRPGDRVVLVGSDPALGAWDPYKGVQMETSDDMFPSWTARVKVPAGSRVEYKFVTVRSNGQVEWEQGENRVLEADAQGRAMVVGGEFSVTGRSWSPTDVDLIADRPTVPTDYLQPDGKGGYVSKAGLEYGADVAYGNRAAHVLGHTEDSPDKTTQGVYTLGASEIFPLIDDLWSGHQHDLSKHKVEEQGKRVVYDFGAGRTIGYVGGNDGTRKEVSTLRLIVQDGNDVVTAFPVEP